MRARVPCLQALYDLGHDGTGYETQLDRLAEIIGGRYLFLHRNVSFQGHSGGEVVIHRARAHWAIRWVLKRLQRRDDFGRR